MVFLTKILKEKDYCSIIKMKYFIYLLVFVFFFSCKSNTIYKAPKDLIPKDTMVLFLTDLYIGISAKNSKSRVSKKKSNFMPFIYEKYKIDSTRFYTSNNYYTSKIEDYNEILGKVKNRIEKKHKVFNTAYKFHDSIKKAKKNEKLEKIKLKDSLQRVQSIKKDIDSLPLILQEYTKDTIPFSKDYFYSVKTMDYNIILYPDIEENALSKGKVKVIENEEEILKLKKIKENIRKKHQEE